MHAGPLASAFWISWTMLLLAWSLLPLFLPKIYLPPGSQSDLKTWLRSCHCCASCLPVASNCTWWNLNTSPHSLLPVQVLQSPSLLTISNHPKLPVIFKWDRLPCPSAWCSAPSPTSLLSVTFFGHRISSAPSPNYIALFSFLHSHHYWKWT